MPAIWVGGVPVMQWVTDLPPCHHAFPDCLFIVVDGDIRHCGW